MSRTFKETKRRRHFADYWKQDRVSLENFSYLQLPTTKPKLRKEVDSEDHWMSTPSWWTKMTMIKPERRAAHLLEVEILKVADIEEFDFPDLRRKPFCYYW